MAPYLKSIARVIGLPVSGSVDETRVVIDGKLQEMEKDPCNVQVILTKDPQGCGYLALRDVDAVFVDAGALEELEEGIIGSGDGEGHGFNPVGCSHQHARGWYCSCSDH